MRSASLLKSIGIVLAVLMLCITAAMVVKTVTQRNSSQDIRSRAANEAATVIDSDALLDVQENAVQSIGTDAELTIDKTNTEDAADLDAVNDL